MLFGKDEVLVAAKHLVDDVCVLREDVREVTYYHVMFDKHEIVRSHGCLSESFDVHGEFAAKDEAVRREIQTLYPELEHSEASAQPVARPTTRQYEAEAIKAYG